VKIFGMTREEVNARYGQLALNVRTSDEYSDADYFEMQLLIALRQRQDALEALRNLERQRQDALVALQDATRDAKHYRSKLATALYE
jgi:hypothetical protein